MTKFIHLLGVTAALALVLFTTGIIGCAGGNQYWNDHNCEQKSVTHWDKDGHIDGKTTWIECDD